VEVETADDDQRGRSVRLTRAGQKLRDRAIPLWRAAQRDVASSSSQ